MFKKIVTLLAVLFISYAGDAGWLYPNWMRIVVCFGVLAVLFIWNFSRRADSEN